MQTPLLIGYKYCSCCRRKFQKFQDKKLRVNTNDRSELEQARVECNLHEAILDRRSKMKADRYCK
jgi:protein FRG1